MTKKRYTAGAARRRQRKQVNRAVWLIAACGVILLAGMLMPSKCAGGNLDGDVPSATVSATDLEHVVTNQALASEMVHYAGMTISFNPEHHVPNWVAYELTADEVGGEEPRTDKFYTDRDVRGCASPDDYRHTGYDRGHMAPAADMKWNPQAMSESFSMANIAPQANVLNRGSWSKLEDKCRQRALKDSAIIIISGPVLTDPVEIRIGDNGVTVPSRFFKVILSPYTTPPTAIGFLMPNGAVKGGMQQCAVSVDSVEAVTGHDFFSALPDEIENYVESHANFDKWSRTR